MRRTSTLEKAIGMLKNFASHVCIIEMRARLSRKTSRSREENETKSNNVALIGDLNVSFEKFKPCASKTRCRLYSR